MAKKIVEVVITKRILIDLPEQVLTEEHLTAFKELFWDVDSHDDLYTCAAEQIALYGATYVEGVGLPSEMELTELPANGSEFHYELQEEDVETEILEDED